MSTSKSITRNRIKNLLLVIPKFFLVTLVLLSVSSSAIGHVGETDEYGCHDDYSGRHHCH